MLKIYIAGSDGMIGSQLFESLSESYEVIGTTYQNLDLLDYASVYEYVHQHQPDVIILTAAKVGGGHAISSNPISFYEDNVSIQTNIMRAACANGITRVILLASAAIYPAEVEGKIKETDLMKGPLDHVQESYALAKLSGVYQSRYYNQQKGTKYVTLVPANLIANRDNGQVVFSLMKQMMAAKQNNTPEVVLWGSGNQRREFVFIDDVIHALKLLLKNYDQLEFDLYNVGRDEDISIRDLSYMIKSITGYQGKLVFDASKPEGVAKRLLDSSQIMALGYQPTADLEEGILAIYNQVLRNQQ